MTNLKKFSFMSLLLFVIAIITSACGAGGSSGNCDYIPFPIISKEIKLSQYSFDMKIGETQKVIAYVDEKEITNEATFTIVSEKNNKNTVVTIEKGEITAVNSGTAKIKVSYEGANDVIFTVKVTDLSELQLSKNNFKINVGSTDKITVTLDGKDVTNSVEYDIEYEEIATVKNGTITAIKAGTTRVNVHHDQAKEDKIFIVTAIDPTLPTLELSQDNFNITMGKTDNVVVTLNGQVVTDSVKYDVENEEIATVENGLITALETGTTFVTVKYEGANDATFTINVTGKLTVLKDGEIIESLDVNFKHTDNVTVMLDGIYDVTEDVEYYIDDEDIITIDKGTITTKKTGTAKVTVHLDGSEEDTEFTVNVIGVLKVYKGDTEIPNPLNINLRHDDQVIVKLNDVDIVTEDVTFTPETEGIINIANDGTITTTKSGTTAVNVTLEGVEDSTSFNVKVNGVLTLSKNSFDMTVGDTDNITVKLNDEDDVTDEVSFTSEDPVIVEVEKGQIKAGGDAAKNLQVNVHLDGTEEDATFTVTVVDDVLQENCVQLNSPTLTEMGIDKDSPNIVIKGVYTYKGTKKKVVSIANYLFNKRQYLESVTIPKTIKTIGTFAFSTCPNLKTVVIENGVKTIGESAFANCTSLANLTIGDSVTTIGVKAFIHCSSLTEIQIPKNIETIGKSAFEGTSITQVTIPAIKTLSFGIFKQCKSLTEITIPEGVEEIGEQAFGECTALTKVTIPNSVKTIGVQAFNTLDGNNTSLQTVTFGENSQLETIGNLAFGNNKNANLAITIPDSVTSIGRRSFNDVENIYYSDVIKTRFSGADGFPHFGAHNYNDTPRT